MKKGKKSILNSEKNRQLIKNMRYSSKINSSRFVDLSEFEDAVDRSFFIEVGKNAAKNAVNENKALRIPITFLLDGWIVRRMPTGELQKVIEVKTGNRIKNRKIAKGTILHAKRSTL